MRFLQPIASRWNAGEYIMPTQPKLFADTSRGSNDPLKSQLETLEVNPTSLVVDTLIDEADGSVTDGDVSLRDALMAIADGGIITFDKSLANGSITLSLGELVIAKSLTIDGNTHNITIDADERSRIFNVDDESEVNDQTVILNGLTITGGKAPRRGGGIRTLENLEIRNSTIINNLTFDQTLTGGSIAGGGIYSRNSDIALYNSTITGNAARGVEQAAGGGIFSSRGTLTVTASTISGNVVNGGIEGFGGGISAYNGVPLTVSNSTISGNHVYGGYQGNGGGISGSGSVTVSNSTISGNVAEGEIVGFGGGISGFGGRISRSQLSNSTVTGNAAYGREESDGSGMTGFGQAVVSSSIIAHNVGNKDIDGSFISQGHNLIGNGDGGRGFTNGVNGDIVGTTSNPVNPRLEGLSDNGGATMTHALLPSSPAINAGNPNDFPAIDQRGVPRPQGSDPDIGAFELDDVIIGSPGSDVLNGTNFDDVMFALGGNDTITGRLGNDTLSGGGDRDQFIFHRRDGTDTITDFGGVGKGHKPSVAAIAEVDVLKFIGSDLTARNMLLTQHGANLEITFEDVFDTKVVLRNFQLENLENLTKATGASVNLGNILFNGQPTIKDSFDVFNTNSKNKQIFNRNSVTFLNNRNNITKGFNKSNDVINGQDGDDVINGLRGDDLLRGGPGHDRLLGNHGHDILIGGESNDRLKGDRNRRFADIFVLEPGDGKDTILDFDISNTRPNNRHVSHDLVGLGGGLSYGQIDVKAASNSRHSLITYNNDILAKVRNVQASVLDDARYFTTDISQV